MRIWHVLLFLSCVAIVALVAGCTAASSTDPIIGTWSRTDPPNSNSFVFNQDGTYNFPSGDNVLMSGSWKRAGDGEYDVTYSINTGHITLNKDKTAFTNIYEYEKVQEQKT